MSICAFSGDPCGRLPLHQKTQNTGKERMLLAARDNTVYHAMILQIFRRLKIIRQLFTNGFLNDPPPGKSDDCTGSASCRSPSMANDAVTPPVVGCASRTICGRLASRTLSTARMVRGSCISERTPSRAPPLDGTVINAALRRSHLRHR